MLFFYFFSNKNNGYDDRLEHPWTFIRLSWQLSMFYIIQQGLIGISLPFVFV